MQTCNPVTIPRFYISLYIIGSLESFVTSNNISLNKLFCFLDYKFVVDNANAFLNFQMLKCIGVTGAVPHHGTLVILTIRVSVVMALGRQRCHIELESSGWIFRLKTIIIISWHLLTYVTTFSDYWHFSMHMKTVG